MGHLPSPTPQIIAEKAGATGWLTFSRPARHNAMSLDMWLAVPEVLHTFSGDPEARVICNQIAENAPLSIASAKATINAMMLNPDTHDREEIDRLARAAYDSFDFREGRTAFMEKRKPQFRGE
jgi:enoyl-CoA hydratase/carnithine racemase